MAKKKIVKAAAPVLPTDSWGSWISWITLAWGLWVVWSYDAKYHLELTGLSQLIDDAVSVSWAHLIPTVAGYCITFFLFIVTLINAFCWGAYCVPKDDSLTVQERCTLGVGAGFFLLFVLTLTFSFLGLLYKPLFWGMALAGAGAGIFLQRRALQDLRALIAAWLARAVSSPSELFIILFSALILVMCFVPEVFYDSLVYHLGLPNLYVQEHRWVDTPNVYFSRFPMVMHTLYTWAMCLRDENLAKLMNAGVLGVGIASVYALCRRVGLPRGGRWAALMILCMPVLQMNNWSTAVDSALSTATVISVLSFILWTQAFDRRWLVYCAAAAGMVFGMKYTGVIIPIFLFAFIPVAARTQPWGQRFRAMILFAGVVTLTMLPWFVRNAITTGNPVYPILSSIIPSRGMHERKMENEKVIMRGYTPSTVGDFLKLPWTLSMRELDSFNFIGPLVLALLPLLGLLWRFRHHYPPALRWVAWSTILYFAMTLVATRQIRYLLPGFFLLSVLLGSGLALCQERWPTIGRLFLGFFLAVSLYQGAWAIHVLQGAYRPMAVLVGAETRQHYTEVIHSGLNPWPWEALRPAVDRLPRNARVMFLGQEKVHRCPRPYVYSSVHDHTPLVLWANASPSPEAFLAKLRAEGVTHLLFNHPEALRLKTYTLFEWTPQGRKNFNELTDKHLRLTAQATVAPAPDGLALYEIVDTPPPPAEGFHVNPVYGDIYDQRTHG